MPIKSILCIFGGREDELAMLETGIKLAKEHTAHLKIFHIIPDVRNYARVAGEGLVFTGSMVGAMEKENKERAGHANKLAHDLCSSMGIELNGGGKVNRPSFSYYERTGAMQKLTTEEARVSDLVLLSRGATEPTVLFDTVMMAVLFTTGTPLIILPEGSKMKKTLLSEDSAAIGWNGSEESARALQASFPFLNQVKTLHILFGEEKSKHGGESSQERLTEYLDAHGLIANISPVGKKDGNIGEALLARCKELNAGMLIMGGYGHSRLRETVLGGVTEYIMQHGEDLPVFICH